MSDQELTPLARLRRALDQRVAAGDRTIVLDQQLLSDDKPTTAVESPSLVPASQVGMAIPVEADFASLTEHNEAICNCLKCPLGKTRTKFVYGVGKPTARAMFIGEAPGADEDRLGEPFVGRAGQLLDKILAAMQLDRTQVYIANILKCRPPGNRDPLPEEMNECFPYLREQIRLIKPELLVGLGRIAGQALLQTKTPLGKLRGRWHEYEGIPLLVTYHPAALLRFPEYKKETWKDMQLVMARLGVSR